MKTILKNGTLTIFLEGELNSFNAEDVENEIEALLKNNTFTSLVLDLKDLRYMSSAGIRIVMRLKQRFDDILLDNMQKDVYDIFDMVGLTKVFNIKRKFVIS